MASPSIGSPSNDEGQFPASETIPPSDYSDSSIDDVLLFVLEAAEASGSDDFDGDDIEYPTDSSVLYSPVNSADFVADGADDVIEDSLAGSSDSGLERVDESSVGSSPAGTIYDSASEGIEDSPDDSQDGSIDDDSDSNSHEDLEDLEDLEALEDQSDSDSDSDSQEQNDHESINDPNFEVADGISDNSISDDFGIEYFLRTARDDSPTPVRDPGDARAQAMPQTRRRSVVESTASSIPTRLSSQQTQASQAESAQARSGDSLASASQSQSQRSTFKRRRSDEPEGMPGPSAAAGLAPGRLPPISSLLESIGSGSSNGSQPSRARPRTSPKRLKREEPIIVDDLFGSDDDGVEMVNLVDVDRPKATQDESEPGSAPAPEPEPEPAPEAPSESLVKFSGLQCVICMDDMSNLTVTHCGHLFCGECLHSSLIMSHDRKICPICRTKLEMRVDGMTANKMARSYFPLVVKLRSANKQGKQPMRPA